jgi:restriction endonuclease S subunit
MAGETNDLVLGDIVSLTRGTTYQGALLGQPGPVLLGLASIKRNGGFRDDNLKTYGGDCPNKLTLRPGDIFVSLKDVTQAAELLGAIARVPLHVPAGRVTQDTVKLTFTRDDIPSRYVYWLLRTPAYREYCRAHAIGTTNLALPREDFLAFPIPRPTAREMTLVEILDALDAKIELNRRMNATLEAIARALFQSWFIDFDPVRANMDRNQPSPGLRPPSPKGRGNGNATALLPLPLGECRGEGLFALDPATAALFPESFQESELGHIPKEWTIQPVGEVVDCVGGGTPSTAEPRYWEGGTHHWTTPKDFSSLQAPILLDTDRKLTDAGIAKISSGLLPAGTLLLSSRAPVGYLAIAAMPVAINQGFIALKCNERASNFFMLNWCQTNMAEIESRATGTTFAEISKQNFRPIRVVLPTKEIMAAFTAKVAPLYAKIKSNLQQSHTLATLRDTLLPKLLSGEITPTN